MAIDPELIRALHLVTEDRASALRDAPTAHHAFQSSTIQALLDARYEGDLTIGELLAHGDLGLGTLDGLDGELIVLDGAAWVARVDGSVAEVPHSTCTPFAVVTPFAPGSPIEVGQLGHEALMAELDRDLTGRVGAVRVRGHFTRLRVRSVPGQRPPYPPLDDVVRQQAEWEIGPVHATLVGFRFPDIATGMEVPGWHLHAISRDRTRGGHMLVADLAHGTIEVDTTTEVHCELPSGVEITAAAADAAGRIHEAETKHG